jgi:GNAT superfamily N-acetyltransferase
VTDFHLRPSSQADLAFVYDAISSTLRTHLERSGQVWPEERFQRRLSHQCSASEFLIIVVDHQQVGALMYENKPDEVWLDTLCLLAPWQSLGVGSALVGRIVDEARSRRVPARLHVFKTNPARGFWERQGFKVVGEDAYAFHMENAA